MKEYNEIDENEIDAKEIDTQSSQAIDTYEKLTKEAEADTCAFNIFSKDNKSLTDFLGFLRTIKENLEEKGENNNITLKPEVQEEKKEAARLSKELEGYYYALKSFTELALTTNTKDEIDKNLNKVKGFENFLKAGNGKTNYQRMIEVANDTNADIKFKTGYSLLEKNLHFGFDFEKIKNAVPKKVVDKNEPKKDAIDWIREFRVPIKKNDREYKSSPNYPREVISQIMAARFLSKAERKDTSTLHAELTKTEIDEKAKELRAEPLFSAFLDEITKDKKKIAKAEESITSGHGGVLDDMFKKYLANLEAGGLNMPESLERYRPTAISRIEALQKKADQAVAAKKSPALEIAEILVLRNAIKAERDNKASLKVPIPVDYSKQKNLIQALAADENFNNIIKRKVVRDYISTGHGGKMIDNIRLQYNQMENKGLLIDSIINEGTIGGRLEKLRLDAKELCDEITPHVEPDNDINLIVTNDKIDEKNKSKKKELTIAEKNKYTDKTIDIISEYLALSIYKASIKKNDVLEQNVPWGKVNDIKNSCLQSLSFKNSIGFGGYIDKAKEALTEMQNSSPSELTISYSNHLNGHVSESSLNKVKKLAQETKSPAMQTGKK